MQIMTLGRSASDVRKIGAGRPHPKIYSLKCVWQVSEVCNFY